MHSHYGMGTGYRKKNLHIFFLAKIFAKGSFIVIRSLIWWIRFCELWMPIFFCMFIFWFYLWWKLWLLFLGCCMQSGEMMTTRVRRSRSRSIDDYQYSTRSWSSDRDRAFDEDGGGTSSRYALICFWDIYIVISLQETYWYWWFNYLTLSWFFVESTFSFLLLDIIKLKVWILVSFTLDRDFFFIMISLGKQN